MSKASGNWVIAAGGVILFVGVCVLLPMAGGTVDPDQIMAGSGLLVLGGLSTSGGIYLKARGKSAGTAPLAEEPVKKARGGCELCGTEAPVIRCKVHQLDMCGTCLQSHYDVRSCVYVPYQGRGRNNKSVAARAR